MDNEIRLGPWRLRPDRGQIVGPPGTRALSRSAVRVLERLARDAGSTVSRRELERALAHDGSTVGPSRLARVIRELRDALGDSSADPTFIATIRGRGYRLLASETSTTTTTLPTLTPGVTTGREPGRYRLREKIGRGGMGVVYRAEDARLGRIVALKFLPESLSEDPSAKQRFLQEARAAAALDHPNICTLHEIDETPEGRMYCVMPFYSGVTLKARLKESAPLAWRQALGIARQVALGLGAAHREGIVHRDVKPANIMLVEGDRVKILDFGVAKAPGMAQLTRTGTSIGTPSHMAPEQARGKQVDGRSDLWAVGVLLYEMLTGQLPFERDSEPATLLAILQDEPTGIRSLVSSIPEPVERIVRRAMTKIPELRYQEASELVRDIDRCLDLKGSRTLEIELPAAPEPAASVAVLPFTDLSAQGDQAYFCDGIVEELIAALAKVSGLKVVSRTSSFQFRDSADDLATIAARLGVGTVLTGSVRRAGARLRISVELVDASDGFVLWSDRYDRQLEDIFAVQDEIATTVVDKLSGALIGDRTSLVRTPTEDLEAYTLYLQGRHQWNKRTESGLRQSVEAFHQALDQDAGFARAHAGIADAYATLGIYAVAPPQEVMPKAEAAARRALELDASLAEAHTSLGCVKAVYEWSWLDAEKEFRRAIDLDANYATAHHWFAVNLLAPIGRFDEAVEEIERAQRLDPLSLAIHVSRGRQSYFARRFERAADEIRQTVALDPGFAVAHFFLGQTLVELGEHDEAVAALERADQLSSGSVEVVAALGHAYARAGRNEPAEATLARLDRLEGERYVSPSLIAQIEVGLGRLDDALASLEAGFALRAVDLAWLRVRPVFAPLRDQPRYRALLEKMGLDDDRLIDETLREVPHR